LKAIGGDQSILGPTILDTLPDLLLEEGRSAKIGFLKKRL